MACNGARPGVKGNDLEGHSGQRFMYWLCEPMQKWDAVELFAGVQTVTSALRESGCTSIGLDILYWAEYKEQQLQAGRRMCEGNPMDINQSAGYASLASIISGMVLHAVCT